MKFWALLFVSFALGTLGYAQASAFPPDIVPDCEVTPAGFRVRHPRADRVAFASEIKKLKLESRRQGTEIWACESGPFGPTKIRLHRFGEGFDLYFEKGFAFRSGALGSPFITWPDGSVGEDIPAAPSAYHLISYREDQPPLLLSYLGGPCGMKISGKPGQWVVRSSQAYRGWIRVLPPLGVEGRTTTSAHDLGVLIKDLEFDLQRWTVPAPNLQKIRASRTIYGLVGVWAFDRPYAIMPPALAATFNGETPRQLRIQCKVGQSRPGAVRWCKERELRVLFPDSQWWPGRAIVSEATAEPKIVWGEMPSVVNAAFSQMSSSRSELSRDLALQNINSFAVRIQGQPRLDDPRTPASLVAAYGLLAQVVSPQRRSDWLSTLADQVGAWSFAMPIPDETELRRAMAITSITLSLCADPVDQLKGAMLDVGLSMRERADPKNKLSPLGEVRNEIFGGAASPESIFGSSSRILTMQPVVGALSEDRLELLPIKLAPNQEVQVLLDSQAGTLLPTFRAIESVHPKAKLWLARNGEKAPISLRGMFAPVSKLPRTLPVYSER
ncbi:MAG: hypothetical protein JST40_06270 [Armatimonadetes bacterium]|nr:hypothetical protein [Armatimonadota bacterium]